MSHLDRPYFVTMGTYQMAILLAFNEHQELTLSELEEASKLNIKELEKQITSLVDAKFLLSNTVSIYEYLISQKSIRRKSYSVPLTACL